MNNCGKSSKEKLRIKKFLRNKRSFILVSILCMGIGFAFLSSNLTITGNTSVSGNSWNVYFTNVQVTEDSVEASVVPTTSGTDTTSIDYTVTLDKPGDFYEFTVDAVNNGTIDAMIQSVNMTNLDTDVAKYLSYTATYLDGTTLAQNDVLEVNDTTTYKVRVEFKKNISAEDLSEEDMNLTLTFGVNYVQSNIKTKSFIKLVKDSALSDSSINFGAISSASNGQGLYKMNSTVNDTNPIYYYRGNVNNNNALFAGFCWKIVRTTETGGTKLLYSGTPVERYTKFDKIDRASYTDIGSSQAYPFTYDNNSKEWSISAITYDPEADYYNEEYNEETWDYYSRGEVYFEFSVAEAGDYVLNYNLSDGEFYQNISVEFMLDWQTIGSIYSENYNILEEGTIELLNLTPEKKITIRYMKGEDQYGYDNNDAFHFSMQKGVGSKIQNCENTGENAQLSTKNSFNYHGSFVDSPAYSGYMYGTVYPYELELDFASYVFGNTFTYENGVYTLSDTHVGVDATHHYTCMSSGTTCESVKYVYYTDGSDSHSNAADITLTGGKSIEDAINEMQTNTNNSTIKTTVDNWFKNTFRTYFTNNNKDYNNYLEDTVWCNDRSMNTLDVSINSWYGTSAVNNGWKPNGGSISNFLMYSSYGRMKAGVPSLTCPNKNDSFTVAESATGNGALTYPVGLLTTDEVILAGGQESGNTDYYLYTNQSWSTMSPHDFAKGSSAVFTIDSYGSVTSGGTSNSNGVRPSISLKPSVKIAIGGDGSSSNPYNFVVE